MLKISRTSENKHHKVYIFRILRKNANQKFFLKIPGITIVAPLKPKKIKMVAEAVEKMQKNPETVKKMEKRKKKKRNGKRQRRRAAILSAYPLIQTYLHTNTSSSSKKSKDISIWLILAKVMSITFKLRKNSDYRHLICPKAFLATLGLLFMRFFCSAHLFWWSINGPKGSLRVKTRDSGTGVFL